MVMLFIINPKTKPGNKITQGVTSNVITLLEYPYPTLVELMHDNEDPFRPTDDEIAKFKEIFRKIGADKLPAKFKTRPKIPPKYTRQHIHLQT